MEEETKIPGEISCRDVKVRKRGKRKWDKTPFILAELALEFLKKILKLLN